MSSFWIAVIVVSLFFAMRSAVRTWRRDMADPHKLGLAVTCFGILAFFAITEILP